MRLINIWLTYDCNLRCSYCYEGEEKSNAHLTYEKCDRIIEYLKGKMQNDDIAINFHGGEPFLYKDIIKYLCDKLKKCISGRIHFSLTTNGTLLDREAIETIKLYNICITLSIDGKKNVHDLQRKKKNETGSFDECFRGGMLLKEQNIPFRCRMTLTPSNYTDMEDNVKYLSEIFDNEIIAIPDLFNHNWTENDMKIIEHQLKMIKSQNLHKFSFYAKKIKERGKCMGGIAELNITPKLDIYPCVSVIEKKEFCLGNIADGIINHKAYEYVSELNNQDMKECEGCLHKRFCTAYRCRLYNFAITGQIGVPSDVICKCENILYNLYIDEVGCGKNNEGCCFG